MNISVGALRRPIFFASLVILMLLGGIVSMRALPVDLNPRVDIPYVVVMVNYPGAGPKEVETVITVPLEEELIALEGLKSMKSTSQDSIASIELEFKMGVNTETVEQKVRDRISLVKARFPRAVLEPTVQKWEMDAMSILTLSIRSESMSRVKLTDWVERELKPQLAQVPRVGKLDILGGLKREIHLLLDSKKLEMYRIPLVTVSDEISRSGVNSPGGLIRQGGLDVGVRNLGEYATLQSLENRVINFSGGETPIRISNLGTVVDSSERETTRAFHKGEAALTVDIFKQSGANVIQITDQLKERVAKVAEQLKNEKSDVKIEVIVDGSKEIRDNVWDVQESILLGILFTIIVVYLFLASARSTLITGLALPNSMLGAFILMYLMGFSINIMSLLALSLAVGLLVDDAIVVRENIFKHVEEGKPPVRAALDGVKEVSLPVIATTIAIIAVFGPVAFIPGIIGQFFREFGLTVCFAMLISLFDALTIAPMLSAYWAGKPHGAEPSKSIWTKLSSPFTATTRAFGRFQDRLEALYSGSLRLILAKPKTSGLIGVGFSIALLMLAPLLPATFMPSTESTSFNIKISLPPGTPLDEGEVIGKGLKGKVDADPGVQDSILIIGNALQESNVINLKATLKPARERSKKASEIVRVYREEVEKLKATLPAGTETQLTSGNSSDMGFPVNFAVLASTTETASAYAKQLLERLKQSKNLVDVHSSEKIGRPELTIKVNPDRAGRFGVSEALVGDEVRGRIEGILAGRFRDQGREYDIRVRMKDGADTFASHYENALVPNLNMTPIRLGDIATVSKAVSVAKLERVNRSSSVTINAGLVPGIGLGAATGEIRQITEKELVPPPGVTLKFEGEAESFAEMGIGFASALGFGIIILYLVLASLYESFFVPLLVMVALPLAAGGAFVGLLVGGKGIDMFSLIGILLLMGVATKNSILMIDTVTDRLREKSDIDVKTYIQVILESSVRRLRPIIMTSMALIAGMIPIAVGLNEASAQRTSMGMAVIGGTISSTLLTLVLLPVLLLLVQKRVTAAALATGRRNQQVDRALEKIEGS